MKPQPGSVVIAQRDIIRQSIDGPYTIPAGTSLMVTDSMDRKGYDRPDRIGVRKPGSRGLSIGVGLGTDVYVCVVDHEHYIGTDTTGDGLDCHPSLDR